MAELEQEAGAGIDAPVKKRKSWIVPVMAVAVLVMAGVVGYLVLNRKEKAPEEVKPQIVLSKQELYLPLDPAFVVNFKQEDSQRFLQVGVCVMSHDQAAIDAAKAADPVIRNALVLLFSSQSYDTLSDNAGRVKLEQEALAQVRKIVGDRLGRPGIEGLYFTSFVMQ